MLNFLHVAVSKGPTEEKLKGEGTTRHTEPAGKCTGDGCAGNTGSFPAVVSVPGPQGHCAPWDLPQRKLCSLWLHERF